MQRALNETPVGGFFGRDSNQCNPRQSLWSAWTDGRQYRTYWNSRAAIAAVVQTLSPRQVWIPAFCCTALMQIGRLAHVRFYGVDHELRIRVESLGNVRDGDAVVGIDYFGWGPERDFLEFVSERKQVYFIEDCAQALVPPDGGWGDWLTFSPRKIAAVADGGILLGGRSRDVPFRGGWRSPDTEGLWEAAIERQLAETSQDMNLAYQKYLELESRMTIDAVAMTTRSREALEMHDAQTMCSQRKQNYDFLLQRLHDFVPARFRKPVKAPFAFPVIVDESKRDAVLRRMHNQGIFASVHWRELPSERHLFPGEHRLADEIVSLPCDHRYGQPQMERVVQVFLEAVS